ncbi:cytochrome b/b6 domain-containing protein [Poseidonibacter lekithochrous]|uniref:cytochrome b/b6 domain-containing protein n=1 Tax=Poseidonibacter TaxID=2321187 RepID=UPI001C091EB4|nr:MULTISPECIES: cytochrome b/b6 domain-containing protein [Poseidonibacter]MBU3013940.1 cytochrome b/b6 domain-containing protein [Poseidonibacter lekithochrous]MDO6827235.1 cytochrome b/b6 domain-containing protein [Poseidonibacter sp. 1_MG-2023]
MTPAMRIIHWVNVFSMIVAIATGLYIAAPYYQTFMADDAVDKYVMAWNRWGHFMVAIIFDVTSVIIAYLFFFSRFEKPWKKVIPTWKNIKEFAEVFLNLVTLNRRKEFDSTHSDSFNSVYFLIFHLLLGWMLFTGLQMYVHGLGSGESSIGAWWPWMLHATTDWTQVVSSWMVGTTATGANIMDVRISHHLTMWLLITWIVFHVYYQVWRTIFWKEGDIAIVIGGDKFVKTDKEA